MRPRFWKHFWKVLGGVWEAKIFDFRIFLYFFDAKFKVQLGRATNQKKNEKASDYRSWREVGGHREAPGKENRMGSRPTIPVMVQHAAHTFGGRRIESPLGGDHRRPPVLDNCERAPDSWRFGRSWRSWRAWHIGSLRSTSESTRIYHEQTHSDVAACLDWKYIVFVCMLE